MLSDEVEVCDLSLWAQSEPGVSSAAQTADLIFNVVDLPFTEQY